MHKLQRIMDPAADGELALLLRCRGSRQARQLRFKVGDKSWPAALRT